MRDSAAITPDRSARISLANKWIDESGRVSYLEYPAQHRLRFAEDQR